MKREFEIDPEKVAQYYRINVLTILLCLIPLFGLGLILMYVYYRWFDQWFTLLAFNSIKYSMDDKTIYAERGIIYFRRVAIPLDQITDITLVQGLVMRYFNIWTLQIQTAGRGYAFPEAVLICLQNPEQIRDEIINTRETYIKSLKSI